MPIARGYAATDASSPLTPFTFERREPNDDDVVIDIKFAGICHSDIHTVRNEWKNAVYPIVPGHEIAGIVKAVGSKVSKFKVGDRVGVGCFVDSCVGCATRDLDNEGWRSRPRDRRTSPNHPAWTRYRDRLPACGCRSATAGHSSAHRR